VSNKYCKIDNGALKILKNEDWVGIIKIDLKTFGPIDK